MVKKGKAIPICPEILAGLPIPRSPVEQQNGKIISQSGEDKTSDYVLGSTIALKVALLANCEKSYRKIQFTYMWLWSYL